MALVGKGRTSGYETETRMNEGRRNGVIWGGGRVGGRSWQIRTMGVAEELRSRRILSTLTTMEWNCRWKTLRFFSLLSFIPVAFFSFFFIKARCINFVANGKWTYYKLSQILRSSLSLFPTFINIYIHALSFSSLHITPFLPSLLFSRWPRDERRTLYKIGQLGFELPRTTVNNTRCCPHIHYAILDGFKFSLVKGMIH